MPAVFNNSHTARFSLTLDNLNTNNNADTTMIFIGLNPSKADGEKISDPTTRIVSKIAKEQGFNRMILINPCAKIETDSSKLSLHEGRPFRGGDTSADYMQLHRQNMTHIKRLLDNHPKATIWCGWGDKIDERKNYHIKFFLSELLELITARNLHCVQIKVHSGVTPRNPRHPRRISFDAEKPRNKKFKVADTQLAEFEVDKYLQRIKNDLNMPLIRLDGPMSYDYHAELKLEEIPEIMRTAKEVAEKIKKEIEQEKED